MDILSHFLFHLNFFVRLHPEAFAPFLGGFLFGFYAVVYNLGYRKYRSHMAWLLSDMETVYEKGFTDGRRAAGSELLPDLELLMKSLMENPVGSLRDGTLREGRVDGDGLNRDAEV